MYSKIALSCFLLAVLTACPSQQDEFADKIEKFVNNSANVEYMRQIADLLNPNTIEKLIGIHPGHNLRQVLRLSNASNEVVAATNASAPELIQMHGYPVEVHTVVTEDGYIIDLHRIPHGKHGKKLKRKRPVLIPPSILCSSACWLILGPGRALPYLLADKGYDVWLSNVRGNTYGRKHKQLDPSNSKFWKWSFHEIGVYDFPATIDYILQVTKRSKLFLIAHSTSTTYSYVMLSEKPKYNKKIKAQFSLTPAAYFGHRKNPMLYFLANFVDIWDFIVHLVGYDEFLPKERLLTRLGGGVCMLDDVAEFICKNSMFILVGYNPDSINKTHVPIIYGHAPAGTSLITMLHYAQLVRIGSSKFQKYDHGLMNKNFYQSSVPPVYRLDQITTSTFCFYGRRDWIIHEEDALKTCGEIPGVQKTFVTGNNNWMHNDFLYGTQAKEEVYDKILKILKRYN